MHDGQAGVRAGHRASAADHVWALRGTLRRETTRSRASRVSISTSAWRLPS